MSLDGQVAHLTSLEPTGSSPPVAAEPEASVEPETGAERSATTDSVVAEYNAIVAKEGGESGATGDALTRFLTVAKAHKDDPSQPCPSPVVLGPVADKDLRRQLHQLFKELPWAPPLQTTTTASVGGAMTCIQLAVGSGQRTGAKRKWREDDAWEGGSHRYVRFALYKENMDTHNALSLVAKSLHFNAKVFGWAGTKDKRAVTVQYVTAYHVAPAKLARVNSSLRGVRLGNFEYCQDGLRLGDLQGNQFNIILRGLTAEAGAVEAAVAALKASGFVNYFGLQRFGSSNVPTQAVGVALLRGDWKEAVRCIMAPAPHARPEVIEACKAYLDGGDAAAALASMPHYLVGERALLGVLAKQGPTALVNALMAIPRNLRTMYLHAYQSFLWNEAASARMEHFSRETAVAGDLVLPRAAAAEARRVRAQGTGEGSSTGVEACVDAEEADAPAGVTPHVVTEEEAAAGKYGIEDVVLPLPGHRVQYPRNAVAEVYQSVAQRDRVKLDHPSHNVKEFSMAALAGAYRHVVFKPADLQYELLRYNDKDAELAGTELQKLQGKPPPDRAKEGEWCTNYDFVGASKVRLEWC